MLQQRMIPGHLYGRCMRKVSLIVECNVLALETMATQELSRAEQKKTSKEQTKILDQTERNR